MIGTKAEMPFMNGQVPNKAELVFSSSPHIFKDTSLNVRTLFGIGKMEQTTWEIDKYGSNIFGLNEVRGK